MRINIGIDARPIPSRQTGSGKENIDNSSKQDPIIAPRDEVSLGSSRHKPISRETKYRLKVASGILMDAVGGGMLVRAAASTLTGPAAAIAQSGASIVVGAGLGLIGGIAGAAVLDKQGGFEGLAMGLGMATAGAAIGGIGGAVANSLWGATIGQSMTTIAGGIAGGYAGLAYALKN